MTSPRSEAAYFEECCKTLRRYARRWMPEPDLSDLVQDCMTVLIEKRAQVEDERAFLYGVARKKKLQYLDKKKRTLGFFTSMVGFDQVTMESLSTRLSVRVARQNDLEQAMSKLRACQFEAFQLRYIECLTEREAAKVLDISTATLKRELGRAREQLRAVLGDEGGEEQLRAIVRDYVRGA